MITTTFFFFSFPFLWAQPRCVSSPRFDLWAVSFVFTRMSTLTLMFLAVGFGLARSEYQGLDLEMGNFNTVLIR